MCDLVHTHIHPYSYTPAYTPSVCDLVHTHTHIHPYAYTPAYTPSVWDLVHTHTHTPIRIHIRIHTRIRLNRAYLLVIGTWFLGSSVCTWCAYWTSILVTKTQLEGTSPQVDNIFYDRVE